MRLTVRDVARLLVVSEKTIYRWIAQGKLPAYRINEQYRFNRAALLEWVQTQRINASAELFAEPESASIPPPSLAQALRDGGIFYRLGGSDRRGALQALVDVMRVPEEIDRDFLLQVLLAREALQSTGVGDGVAIPHPRSPIILHTDTPRVTLGFLERSVDFGALDGQPVFALFSVISPTARAHLQLLSRIAFALRDPHFKEQIVCQAGRDDILEALSRLDSMVEERGPVPTSVSPL